MITSFYFVMWILIYFLIIISGSYVLNEYGFFVAFIGVYLIGAAATALCRDVIARRNKREFISLLEIYYTGDHAKLCSILHKRLLLLAASFIYMVVATAGLLLGHASWIIIGIFAFFTFTTGRAVHRANAEYQELRQSSSLAFPSSGPWYDALRNYAANRQVADFKDLCPMPTTAEKALRIFNILMSLLCILIGAFFIYLYGSLYLTYGSSHPEAVINLAYGLLALVYGINDLYTLIKGYNFNFIQ